MTTEESSCIDYEAFLDPSFSPTAFANTLILTTNDSTDTILDLATPLSRVLFDVQEVDTHIDSLTTRAALPLLEYTQTRANASTRILDKVEIQVAALTAGYQRLEKDVIEKYEAAELVRLAAERLCRTVRLGRVVSRCVQHARQLEMYMADMGTGKAPGKKDGHRAMIPAAHTLLSLCQLLDTSGPGTEGQGLDKLAVINTIRNHVVTVAERNLVTRAQQTIREFSMSSLVASNTSLNQQSQTMTSTTFVQTEDTKNRTISALTLLYLLSPIRQSQITAQSFEPTLLVSTLQTYLQTALTSSVASLARALATLPTLDRTLIEISARCQNIVALEALLASTPSPTHPLFPTSESRITPSDLLTPLLTSLDTSSLPSYFWRSVASNLSTRVQEIILRGGVSARTLRSNKEKVAQAVRECVHRGNQIPGFGLAARGGGGGGGGGGGRGDSGEIEVGSGTVTVGMWEREAAVMVGSILGNLGRS